MSRHGVCEMREIRVPHNNRFRDTIQTQKASRRRKTSDDKPPAGSRVHSFADHPAAEAGWEAGLVVMTQARATRAWKARTDSVCDGGAEGRWC